MAVLPAADAAEAHRLAGRVHLIGDGPATPVPATVADAVAARRVLRIRYADRAGADSTRDVEPLGYLGNSDTGTWWPGAGCATSCAASAPTGSWRSKRCPTWWPGSYA